MVHLLETIVWQNSTPSEKVKLAKHKAEKPVLYMPEFMKTDEQKQKTGIAKDTVSADVDTIKNILALPRG